MSVHSAVTEFGFDFGPAKVKRYCYDAKRGWVVIGVESPKHRLQVYVTKTGKIRVYRDGKELT